MLNRPARPKVFIKNLNRFLNLNFITIMDEEWIRENFPDNSLTEMLKKGDVDTVLKLLWRLLDDESKTAVATVQIMLWDGTEKKPLETKDPVVRLKSLISASKEEIEAIMHAIFDTRTKSNPDAKESEKKSNPQAET